MVLLAVGEGVLMVSVAVDDSGDGMLKSGPKDGVHKTQLVKGKMNCK